MLVEITPDEMHYVKVGYKPYIKCLRWHNGRKLKWTGNPTFRIWDYPILLAPNNLSNMPTDRQFFEFCETCTGNVYLGDNHTPHRIYIGFTEHSDAVLFKLRWG